MSALPNIWFVGDPHGEIDFVLRAIERHGAPDAVLLLGDLEPPCDLAEWLAPVAARTTTRLIIGNHDTDTREVWDRIANSRAWPWNIGGRVENIAGVNIAGLGGIFRSRVWYPDCPSAEPVHRNYRSIEKTLAPSRMPEVKRDLRPAYAAHQKLLHSSSIFPDVYDGLRKRKADVLVSHEAPKPHYHGFQAINDLAAAMGVQRTFHGHHHERVRYPKTERYAAFSVGLREIVGLDGELIA